MSARVRIYCPWVRQMMYDFLLAALLALQFVGISAIAFFVMLRLLRTEKDAPCVWLLEVRTVAHARDRLYALHMRRQLLGEADRCAIIALDVGVPSDDRRELERFCASVPRMYCCTPQELSALLETLRG